MIDIIKEKKCNFKKIMLDNISGNIIILIVMLDFIDIYIVISFIIKGYADDR